MPSLDDAVDTRNAVVPARRVDPEKLAARFQEICFKQYSPKAFRVGAYKYLTEDVKDTYRALAQYVLAHFVPQFDPNDGLPEA